MGPAAVGPGSVRVPIPTRRRGPQPCCSRRSYTYADRLHVMPIDRLWQPTTVNNALH